VGSWRRDHGCRQGKPSQYFAEVDYFGNGTNLQGLQFNTAQGAFLAAICRRLFEDRHRGHLRRFEDRAGHDLHGRFPGRHQLLQPAEGQSVKLLGWDEKKQNGSFAGSFTDQTKGTQLATNFVAQGADVIFPVAGGTGLGSAPTPSPVARPS